MSLKFYTSYNPPPSKAEPKCSRTRPEYTFNTSSDKLEQTGIDPFYERTQSYYESTRLSYKLRQFNLGDSSALGEPHGQYIDISNAPTNLAQVLNADAKARAEFDGLPEAIRKLFDGNYSNFVTSIEQGTYSQKLTDYAKSELERARGKDPGKDPGKGGEPSSS